MGTVCISLLLKDCPDGQTLIMASESRVTKLVDVKTGNAVSFPYPRATITKTEIVKNQNPRGRVRLNQQEKTALKMHQFANKYAVAGAGTREPSESACKILKQRTEALIRNKDEDRGTHDFLRGVLEKAATDEIELSEKKPELVPSKISFIFATPSEDDDDTSDFLVSLVKPEGNSVQVKDPLCCIGCGADEARDFLDPHKHNNYQGMTGLEGMELVRDAVHWSAYQNKLSVGGRVLVWAIRVKRDGRGKKFFDIEQITFPTFKDVIWVRCDDLKSGVSIPYVSFEETIYPIWDHSDAIEVLEGRKRITTDLRFYSRDIINDNFFYRSNFYTITQYTNHRVTFGRDGSKFILGLGPDMLQFKETLGLTDGMGICIFWDDYHATFVMWPDKERDGGKALR